MAHQNSLVIVLYIEARVVVKQMLGKVSFEVKVGLCQRSELNPLLFAVGMDGVSNTKRRGLPSVLRKT